VPALGRIVPPGLPGVAVRELAEAREQDQGGEHDGRRLGDAQPVSAVEPAAEKEPQAAERPHHERREDGVPVADVGDVQDPVARRERPEPDDRHHDQEAQEPGREQPETSISEIRERKEREGGEQDERPTGVPRDQQARKDQQGVQEAVELVLDVRHSNLAVDDLPIAPLEQQSRVDERVVQVHQAVEELERRRGQRDPCEQGNPSEGVVEQQHEGDDDRKENRAELPYEIAPAEEDAGADHGDRRQPSPRRRLRAGRSDQQAEKRRGERRGRGQVGKDLARVDQVVDVQPCHERRRGRKHAISEEKEHDREDSSDEDHARENRDRVEGGFGGPEDEECPVDRGEEPDPQGKEVRGHVREVGGRAEVPRGVERMRPLQEHKLDDHVEGDRGHSDRPIQPRGPLQPRNGRLGYRRRLVRCLLSGARHLHAEWLAVAYYGGLACGKVV
jgi:hypothetical protein